MLAMVSAFHLANGDERMHSTARTRTDASPPVEAKGNRRPVSVRTSAFTKSLVRAESKYLSATLAAPLLFAMIPSPLPCALMLCEREKEDALYVKWLYA